MIIIRDIAAATGITSELEPYPAIRQLIHQRIAEITQGEAYDASIYGEFSIVEAGDSMPEIEAYIGRPLIGNFEWLVEWPCCYEVVFILSDDGFGIDLLIPKLPNMDADLLAICTAYAVPAESDSESGARHE